LIGVVSKMDSDAQNQNLRKVAHHSGFIGQDGINLIATIVGSMRHLWTPTSAQSDLGIDGYIELCRDSEDGKRVATNFIIQVQSKATHSSWLSVIGIKGSYLSSNVLVGNGISCSNRVTTSQPMGSENTR
jgi:Domain of unknown function (DUF4365)